jgi:glucokinase
MAPLLQAVPVWLSFDPHAGLRGAAAGFSNSHMAARMISPDQS